MFKHGGFSDSFNGILLNKGANRGGFGYFLTRPWVWGAEGQSGNVFLEPMDP